MVLPGSNVSIVVPTFNEAPNIESLVARIAQAVRGVQAEIIFVDDSTDGTAEVIDAVARSATIPVRVIARTERRGGLGGAVLEGFAAARSNVCIVMDGDHQHPPEKIPELIERFERGDVDVVVASRYAGGGTTRGLAGRWRVGVSKLSTMLTKSMFPVRMKDVTDPMTGFFLIDTTVLDSESLHPRGFKILLEILARRTFRVAEIPFDFADRHAGESKASVRQGIHFLTQLAYLRFGKLSVFAVIGGLGALANIAIVWILTQAGINYLASAVIAAELTIIANFLLIERFVFGEMRGEAAGFWARAAKSVSFNNAELLIRIPIVALMVESGHITAVLATAITLVVAFFARFVFHALVVYAPRRAGDRSPARRIVEGIDAQAMTPGEL